MNKIKVGDKVLITSYIEVKMTVNNIYMPKGIVSVFGSMKI